MSVDARDPRALRALHAQARRLEQSLTARGVRLHRALDPSEAPDLARRVLPPHDGPVRVVGDPLGLGDELRIAASAHEALDEPGTVVCGVHAALARTGTLCLVTSPEDAALAGLAARLLVVVGVSQVIGPTADLAAALRRRPAGPGQVTSLCCGPVAEDGPREVHVLLVDDVTGPRATADPRDAIARARRRGVVGSLPTPVIVTGARPEEGEHPSLTALRSVLRTRRPEEDR